MPAANVRVLRDDPSIVTIEVSVCDQIVLVRKLDPRECDEISREYRGGLTRWAQDQAELAIAESTGMHLPLDMGAPISLYIVGAICAILAFATVGFFLGKSAEQRSMEHNRIDSWNRAELVRWTTEGRSGTEPELAAIFNRCSALNVREALPLAIMWSTEEPLNESNQPREVVIAARSFVSRFSYDELEKVVRSNDRLGMNAEFVLGVLRRITQ